MDVREIILNTYPELVGKDLLSSGVYLQDDLDGKGIWVVEWNYDQPLPKGVTIGK